MEQSRTDKTQSGELINRKDPRNSPALWVHHRPNAGSSSQTSNEQSVVGISSQLQTNACRSISSTQQKTFPVIQLNADTNQTALEFFKIESTSSPSCHVGTVRNIIPSNLQCSVSRSDRDDLHQTVIPAFIVVSKKRKLGNEVICIDEEEEENSSGKKDGKPDQSTKATSKTTHLIQPVVGQGSVGSQVLIQTQTISTAGSRVPQQPPTTIPQSSNLISKLNSTQPNPAISTQSSKQTTKDICKIGNIDKENVPTSAILSRQTGSLPNAGSLCCSKECTYSSSSIPATDISIDQSTSTSPDMCNVYDNEEPISLIQQGIPLIGNSQDLCESNPEMLKEVPRICKVCGEESKGSPFGVPACLSCSVFFRNCTEDDLKISRHRQYMGRCGCQLCHLFCCYLRGMKPENSDFLVCTVCSKPFISRYFLIQHQKNCQKSPVSPKCDTCGLTFATDSQLKQHKKSKVFCEKDSTAGTDGKYKCDICWESFSLLGALVLHRYTHLKVDDEMTEMENSLEVKTFQINPENPIIIDDCEELIVIDVEKEGKNNHSETNDESGIADNEIKTHQDGIRTHIDNVEHEDQNSNIPEERENIRHLVDGQPGSNSEKMCVDDSAVYSEETESRVQSGTQLSQGSQKCSTVNDKSEISSDDTGEMESEENHVKTVIGVEETEKESGLGNSCSIIEYNEESSDELLEEEDDEYILVTFDSSDEEDNVSTVNHCGADCMDNNEQEHDNSKDHEIPPTADVIIRNNEMSSQIAESGSTTMLPVSTSHLVMESIAGTDKNITEGTKQGNAIPEVSEVSMECQQEISEEKNGYENTDFEKMQPSMEIEEEEKACMVKTKSNTNIQSAQSETGETWEKNNSPESSNKDSTVTVDKATALQDSSFSADQSGSKSHVKVITNEDGGEKLEVHFVLDDKTKTGTPDILESLSSSENAVTVDEISSTVPDDINVEYPSNESAIDKENMTPGIQPPQNDDSQCKTTGKSTNKNMNTCEESAELSTLSDKQSDVGRKDGASMPLIQDQEKSESKQKYQKNEEQMATADIICLSSDEEEENVKEKSAGDTGQETVQITDDSSTNAQTCKVIQKASKNNILGDDPKKVLRNEYLGSHVSELNPSSTGTTSQSHKLSHMDIVIDLDPEEDSYICYLCKSKFPSVQDIQLHLKKVHSYFNNSIILDGFFCCHCKDKFNSLGELSIHESTVHGFKFSCPLCGIHQKDHELFLTHIMEHLSPWILYCVLCKLEFRKEDEFKEHNSIKHGGKVVLSESLKCCICDSFFADKGKYYEHLRIFHDKLFKFPCKVCFQSFCTRSALKVHRSSLDNFLSGSRTKIAEFILIDSNAVDVKVISEIPLSNFHRRYLSTPTTSEKAKLAYKRIDQESILRKCSLTDTRKGIVISGVNSRSLQNDESADSTLESRQGQPVTDISTHGDPNDMTNRNIACEEESLPDIQRPKQSETSASSITDLVSANDVTSTAEDMVTNLRIVGHKTDKESQGHEKESQGHVKESQGHEKESQGHEKESQGHVKESQGHEKESQGHEKESQGHEKETQGHVSEELASNRDRISMDVECKDTSSVTTQSTTSTSINDTEPANRPFKNPEKRNSVLPTIDGSGILDESTPMLTSCEQGSSGRMPDSQTVDLTTITDADFIEEDSGQCSNGESFIPIGNIMTIQPKEIREKENTGVMQHRGNVDSGMKDSTIFSFDCLVEKVFDEYEHKTRDAWSKEVIVVEDGMPDSGEAGEYHSSQRTLRRVQNNENLPTSSSKSLNSSQDENIPVEIENVISNLLSYCKRPKMMSSQRRSSNAVERISPKVNSIPYKGAKGMNNFPILQGDLKHNSVPVMVDQTTERNLNVDQSSDSLRSLSSQEHSRTEEMDHQVVSTPDNIKSNNFFVTKSVLSVLEGNPSLLLNDWKETLEESGKGTRLRAMHPDLNDFIKLTNWKSSPLVLAKVNALLHKKFPVDNNISRADTTRSKDGRILIGERKELFADIKNTLEKFEDDPHLKRNPINFENLDRMQCTKDESLSKEKHNMKNTVEAQKTYVYSHTDLDNAVKRLSSVVQAIAKRKLDECGPPDSTEMQVEQPKKKIKIVPAKDVLNQDQVFVSMEGEMKNDGNEQGPSSETLNSRKLSDPSAVVMAYPVTVTQLSTTVPQVDINNTLGAEEGGMQFDIVKE